MRTPDRRGALVACRISAFIVCRSPKKVLKSSDVVAVAINQLHRLCHLLLDGRTPKIVLSQSHRNGNVVFERLCNGFCHAHPLQNCRGMSPAHQRTRPSDDRQAVHQPFQSRVTARPTGSIEHDITLPGYQGPKFRQGLQRVCRRINVEIVKRSDLGKFVVLPRRWVVERSIAWLNRCRRLAKDWECLNRNALAFLRWASVRLMVRKLCQETK